MTSPIWRNGGQLVSAMLVFGLLATSAKADHNTDNEIYRNLLKTGVPFSAGNALPIQKPVMDDGLNAAAQRKVIEGLVPARFLDSFLKGDRNDRFELKMSAKPGNGAQAATGRIIDVYFIANAPLSVVANKNFMKQQFSGANGKAAFLTDEELKKRDLKVIDNATIRERYAHANFDLFNLVQLGATGHGEQSHEKDSEIIAFIVDPAFRQRRAVSQSVAIDHVG